MKTPLPDVPLQCDICLATPRGLWFYPYSEFTIHRPRLILVEPGDWAVCDECAALIDPGDLDGMVRKALEEIPLLLRRSLVHALYSAFLEHRVGPPVYSEVRLDPARLKHAQLERQQKS